MAPIFLRPRSRWVFTSWATLCWATFDPSCTSDLSARVGWSIGRERWLSGEKIFSLSLIFIAGILGVDTHFQRSEDLHALLKFSPISLNTIVTLRYRYYTWTESWLIVHTLQLCRKSGNGLGFLKHVEWFPQCFMYIGFAQDAIALHDQTVWYSSRYLAVHWLGGAF